MPAAFSTIAQRSHPCCSIFPKILSKTSCRFFQNHEASKLEHVNDAATTKIKLQQPPQQQNPVAYVHSCSLWNHPTSSQHMDYVRGWAWQTILLQQRLRRKRLNDDSCNSSKCYPDHDMVLLLEHEPVYTLGRGADVNHLTFLKDKHSPIDQHHRWKLSRQQRGVGTARLAVDRTLMESISIPENINCNSNNNYNYTVEHLLPMVDQLIQRTDISPVLCPENNAPIYRVERGGEVTYHGPGQLIVYPLMDLQQPHLKADLHWFLRQMEQVIIDTLHDVGLPHAERDSNHTGVWVCDRKIAAMGVTASRWITTHGLAINVHTDLNYFDSQTILPCGIEGKGVTSLMAEGITGVTLQDVAQLVVRNMQRIFRIEMIEGGTLR